MPVKRARSWRGDRRNEVLTCRLSKVERIFFAYFWKSNDIKKEREEEITILRGEAI